MEVDLNSLWEVHMHNFSFISPMDEENIKIESEKP